MLLSFSYNEVIKLATEKLVICPKCTQKLSKVDAINHNKRYYHPECFEEKEKEDELKKQYSAHYKDLIEYICNLYGLDAPTGMILKQIKDYQEDYNYKLQGIKLALQYFHETLNNPVIEGNGIGIVVYVYEEAKRHYIQKLKVQQSLDECEGEPVTLKQIKVKSPQLKTIHQIKIIDISSL